MEILKGIIEVLILITAYPVGLILAWFCKDEIIYRKYFIYAFYLGLIVLVVTLIFFRSLSVILTLIYLIIILIVALIKAKDKKFVKR